MSDTNETYMLIDPRDKYLPALRRIVSVDGEEKKVNGRSSYYLLAAADDNGFRAFIEHDGSFRPSTPGAERRKPDSLTSNAGLPTVRCLEFLLSLPTHPSDLFIAYSFSYDITKILQDLPYANQLEFAKTHKTTWNGYSLSGIPKKFFEVRHGTRRVKVWDVFSYWQMSFANALHSNMDLFQDRPGATEKINYIVKMKALRADQFPNMSDDEIREYCFNECEYASVLYRDILVNCRQLGLTPRMHSGPGALAEAFFTAHDVKHYSSYGDMMTECGMPRQIPMFAYYGGRFEVSTLGNIGDVWQYDIHSAYPAVAVKLPCLACGTFRRVTEYVSGNRWGFYLVSSHTSGPWAPFPFRSSGERIDQTTGEVIPRDENGRQLKGGSAVFNGAMKGSIAFAHGGKRWVTADEVEVALKFFPVDQIEIHAGWVYQTPCHHKPFAALEELYLRRKHPEKKKEVSKGMGKVIKLIINSVYGKTAQSIGGDYGTAPTFQCYPWAAWMTGGTRAKVFEAAMLGGSDVVAIATDGILTKREIPELPISDWELGKWEKQKKEDCWIGKPGIYAFGKDVSSEFKRRGLDGRYFPAELLRSEWDAGEWIVYPKDTPTGFMPLQLAVLRTDWNELYGQWVEFPKKNNFYTNLHKRNFPDDVDMFMPHPQTVEMTPFTLPTNARSLAYLPKSNWSDAYNASESGDMDLPIWESEDLEEMENYA